MIRQHHRINTAVALSAIAAALLVAGCGGSSSSGWVAGVNTVRAAYVSSNAAGYQMAIKVTGNAAGHTINVTGTGTFAQAADRGRLTIHVSQPTLGGRNLQIDYVILGKDAYLKLPASLAGKIPGGKPWLQLDLSEIGKRAGIQGLSSLVDNPGENPARLLQILHADSTGTIQTLGHQTIDGVHTTALRATVDVSKVFGGLRYLPIEAWVDSSNHVRRIVLSETGHVGSQPFSEKVQLDFVKYGPEPVPAAPPADEVTNIMSLFGTS